MFVILLGLFASTSAMARTAPTMPYVYLRWHTIEATDDPYTVIFVDHEATYTDIVLEYSVGNAHFYKINGVGGKNHVNEIGVGFTGNAGSYWDNTQIQNTYVWDEDDHRWEGSIDTEYPITYFNGGYWYYTGKDKFGLGDGYWDHNIWKFEVKHTRLGEPGNPTYYEIHTYFVRFD